MTRITQVLVAVAIAGIAFIAGRAGSATESAAYGEPPQHKQDAPKKPESSQKQQEVVAQTEAGEAHKPLAALVGDWDAEVKVWYASGKPPMSFKETVKRESLFDDRFVMERVDSAGAVGPYHGLSVLGYNIYEKRYEIFFIDNGGTAMNLWTGTFDEAKKTFSFAGNELDLGGRKVMFRTTIDCSKPDTQIKEGFKPGRDGKEFKTFEVKLTRKK